MGMNFEVPPSPERVAKSLIESCPLIGFDAAAVVDVDDEDEELDVLREGALDSRVLFYNSRIFLRVECPGKACFACFKRG